MTVKRTNSRTVFILILTVLAALALYKSEIAYQHRNLMEGFVLIVVAMIFVKQVQKRV